MSRHSSSIFEFLEFSNFVPIVECKSESSPAREFESNVVK